MKSGSASNNKKQAVNPLELVRDAGSAVKHELVDPMPDEFMRQLLGKFPKREDKKFSGEILPGMSLQTQEIYTGVANQKAEAHKAQVRVEWLRHEDRILVERRTNELKIQIKAIHQEIQKAAKATVELTEEIKIAAFQDPSEFTEIELTRLERLFERIKSFRKRIENAQVWLMSMNRKRAKKNMWGANYKKHGAKYLLSSEHYLQRSAG